MPAASTTFETLPPVGIFTYPTGATDIVAQISVDGGGPLMVPLLTLYGDGRAIAADGDRWVQGRVGELAVQEFLDDVRSVGLLDDDLVLRIGDGDGLPSITIRLDVDGRRFDHELDLVRIERPAALRAFLQRAATSNVFDLTSAFEPEVWINCDGDTCRAGDGPDSEFSRPVLANESVDALIATAATGEP